MWSDSIKLLNILKLKQLKNQNIKINEIINLKNFQLFIVLK